MPLQATSGAASYDAFGGGVPVEPVYIEQIFQTWLYTGNGSTQTITNGIDLAGKGGMVWIKKRSQADNHFLFDTNRGATFRLIPNAANASSDAGDSLVAFNSNGFNLDGGFTCNGSGDTLVSWTFRKQPKFFDVVTYTGDGTSSGKVINHQLGSVPGAVIIKRTDSTSDWWAQIRRSDGQYAYGLRLNSTAAQQGVYTPTSGQLNSTQFNNFIADDPLATNTNGATYVAYLFAHNAGGFGLTGTDNVISCGSFVANTTVDLGYEPQWVMLKNASATGGWYMFDNMRGMPTPADTATLFANLSAAEGQQALIAPTSTGFTVSSLPAGNTFIYIAIRRGPMRTPTTGTSVFSPNTQTGANTSAGQTLTTNFPVDLEISMGRNVAYGNVFIDRLRGGQNYLLSQNTNAEVNFTSYTPLIGFANNTGITDANYGSTSASYVAWNCRRAPGFFDEVCYTGTGVARTVAHNLTVVPELMIVKGRNQSSTNWAVYSSSISNTLTLYLNATLGQSSGASYWNSTTPTSSVFTVGNNSDTNTDTYTYVAYLFATCPGVSKVGSYTGTGATQTINCGFTGGARFVLIKRTDSTGNWYVWDTARGMVSGTDPYLLLNSATPESNTNLVFTAATGFQIVSSASDINASGGTYIFLAIA